MAVVLSTTISEALAGTLTVETIGYAVPPEGAEPCATAPFEYRDTVVFTALVPSTLAATIWLIFSTVPEAAALGSRTTAVVPLGV